MPNIWLEASAEQIENMPAGMKIIQART